MLRHRWCPTGVCKYHQVLIESPSTAPNLFALRRTGAGREQALRLAGEDLARRVEPGAVQPLLEAAAAGAVPIMCFVGNPGCIQIFSGSVERIVPMGPWLNVLDPDFNLHLRADRVAAAWVVVKPTRLRGAITSLELFDAVGETIALLFSKRKPGQPELAPWPELLATLPSVSA